MAWVSGQAEEKPKQYKDILINWVEKVGEVVENPNAYYLRVEHYSDLASPYFDEDFMKVMADKKLRPDLSNPYFNKISDADKRKYARELFKALNALILRVGGVMDVPEVTGVISEYDGKMIEFMLDLERKRKMRHAKRRREQLEESGGESARTDTAAV